MAQTKPKSKSTKASSSRSSGGSKSSRGSGKASSSRSRSNGSSKSSSRSRSSGRASSRAKPRSSGPRSKSAQAKSKARSTKGTAKSTARKGASKAKSSAPSSNGSFLDKAKGPATAVGAALLGAAGMAAARGKKSSGLFSKNSGPKLSLPKPKSGPKLPKGLKNMSMPKLDDKTIDWVEQKARQVGTAGNRVADATSEARRVQKAMKGEKK